MAMEIVHYANIAGARQSKHHLPNDAKGDLEKDIILNTSNRLEGKTRILRASDVLLSIAGRSITNETREPTPAVENFQEVLRLFPPFRDDDGAILGALDVKCPDCDAVFSSSNELNQHYLTRYCAGTAVAVYVMMRDRLITKGYRMEKRLIPLDSRPIRFFCSECEKPFSLSEDGQIIERQRTCFLDCTHCGSKCNILYEPILNDPRDDTNYRDIHKEISSANHSRSPSLVQKSSMASKFSVTDFNSEQSLAKKARKLRDSWSFRKMSQSDEEELLAMSFAGLYDLEKAHAPNGMYQPLPTDTGVGVSDSSFCSDAFCLSSVIEPLREDESQRQRSDVSNSEGGLVDDSRNVEYDTPKTSKRQSFFQKLFGRKIKTSISRSRSTSGRGKKLMKRANTIRFSFVTKYRSESRATGHESPEASEEALTQETDSQNNSSTTVQDAEYVTLLRGTQNIFVHLQYLSGGAIVHDASGRQRILQVDEIARLFLQIRDELTSTTVWSRALTAKLRAEALLRQGHPQAAVVEFHEAMKILDDMPGLDTEKQTRAAILHSLGHAYRDLDLPAESEACYLEALGLYKRVLGRDHPKNFAVIHDLGSLCERDGYATEAAALYERSFAGRLKTLGHNAPETLSSMQDLASLKVLLGDLESALLLLKKAVPALDTVFGIQNATTLNAMNKLSLLYQKLRLEKESRTICGRTIPHCRTVFGLSSPVTRDAVVRYIQSSDNFDFPPDIKDVLDGYRRSRDPDCLRVIHRLGRAYMDAGLNRDAATLFEALVEDFLAVKGPDAPETFDALSALCVTREHLDALDKAILAYKQLVHMASRTPEHHHSRKRIGYAEKRISELNRRREILESERKEWELNDAKSCENCGHSTVLLCSKCNIARFCSDTCLKQASLWHTPHCIPSVSLRESKSLAVKPKCPPSARDQALSKISHYNGLTGIGMKDIVITASYTFYLDPRNFTTFRMKLKDNVNTVFLFSLDSDVQYTVVTGNPPPPPPPSQQRPESKGMGKLSIPRPTTSSNNKKHTQHNHPKQPEERTWITPQSQDFVSHAPLPRPSLLSQAPHSLPHHLGMGPTGPPPPPSNPKTSPGATPAPGGETYILIKPGKEMHKSLIEKRIAVRAGPGDTERDLFAGLDSPNKELIEYAQGLLLTGYLGEVVVYVIEWVWK